MIHPNSVAFSLYTTLSSDSTLVNSNFKVDLQEVYNTDPDKTPWVGVYFDGIDIEPHHTQQPAPWMATYNFQVLVQDHSHEGGEKTIDRVMRDITPVFTAINSNRNLDGTVHIITGMEIIPFAATDDRENEDWLFTYAINLTAEVFA